MIELIENERTIELTSRMISKGREPHSVIICGEKGLGKRTIARYLAAQLLCENGGGTPCGTCRNCRLVEKNEHPDVITAVSSETGNYKVEDIRTIVSDAYISPSEGRYKIYIIPDIDRSPQTSVQLQNILLKTIEEPPASSVLILTARSKEIFLETIISRTVHLNAAEVSPANAMAYLIRHGKDRQLAEEAVRRCGGNIGRALFYTEDEEERASAEAALSCCRALAAHDEYILLKTLSDSGTKKNSFLTLTGYMTRIIDDAVKLRTGAGDEFMYSREVCRALGNTYSLKRLADIYDALTDHSGRAAANCLVQTLHNSLAATLAEI